jgi:hypothetical protein
MRKRKQKINYLDIIPVRNVSEYTDDEGKITLMIPKFRHEWMRRWLIPGARSKYIKIHLDGLGSKVWRMMDGKQNTGAICELLSADVQTEGSNNHDLELRVTGYLTKLYKNRFILFKSPGQL